MKLLFTLFILLFTSSLSANEKNEKNDIEIFAENYLKTFEDKLSTEDFKIVLDVNDSEIIMDKKYGTFKYKFNEYHIDKGKMIIEKNFSNLNFQLISNSDNPLFSINYRINFNDK